VLGFSLDKKGRLSNWVVALSLLWLRKTNIQKELSSTVLNAMSRLMSLKERMDSWRVGVDLPSLNIDF